MRFIVLAFTASLAIAQTSPPHPRQTADTRTGDAQAPKSDGAKKLSPSPSSPRQVPIGKSGPAAAAKNANDDKREEGPNPIEVSKFPPVPLDRDWVDYTLLVLNLGLVIVGALGVRAALKTLEDIKKQTKNTEAAVHALMNSERGWMVIDKLADFTLTVNPNSMAGVTVMFVQFKNAGKTICRTKQWASRFHTVTRVEDLPPIPEYKAPITTENIVAPDGRTSQLMTMLEEVNLSDAMIEELRRKQRFLCYYFRVDYEDAHGKSHVWQDCYIYNCPIGLVLSGIDKEEFLPGGPRSYRQYT